MAMVEVHDVRMHQAMLARDELVASMRAASLDDFSKVILKHDDDPLDPSKLLHTKPLVKYRPCRDHDPSLRIPAAVTGYETSSNARGFITVWQYSASWNGRTETMMFDCQTGHVKLCPIWRLVTGGKKVSLTTLFKGRPDLEKKHFRLRGGDVLIQGHWIEFEVAKELAERVAWNIRDKLVPIFGRDFPKNCWNPNKMGYMVLSLAPPDPNKRQRAQKPPVGPAPKNGDKETASSKPRNRDKNYHKYPPNSLACIHDPDTNKLVRFRMGIVENPAPEKEHKRRRNGDGMGTIHFLFFFL
ncbi:hypothetical protein BT69DRAFT_984973 [Atractiella rhizophila]|nr:hypothetical protein BT69DRAFT_984973 [Atractiella rhizophila]